MTVVDRFVERLRRIPPIVVDAAIGAWIFAIGTHQLIQLQSLYPRSQRPLALVLLGIAAFGVTLRRKNVLVSYALVILAAIVGLVFQPSVYPDGSGAFLAGLVMLYTVSEGAGAIVSSLALLAGLVIMFLARRTDGVSWIWLIQAEDSWIVLAFLAGRAQALRHAKASGLTRTALHLQEERDRLARSAVATERNRIARELHALVVHGVERMIAQTQASRDRLANESGRVSKSISAIETTGRDTLVEMRRLLAVLRTQADAATPSDFMSEPTQLNRSSPADDVPSQGPAAISRFPRLYSRLVQQAGAWVAVPWLSDALVVLVMAALAAGEPFMVPWHVDLRTFIPTAMIVVGALILRRHAPFAVLAVIAAVIFAYNVWSSGDPYTADRAFFVAVFTVAAIRGLWWGVAALGVEVLAYAPLAFIPGNCDVPCQLTWSSQMVFAIIAGIAVYESRRLNLELQQQTDMLQRTRHERARLAVHAERSRVARDVHDMVAHSITIMVINAGAARWLAESKPLRADQALQSVQEAGRDALRELHSLVDSLGAPTSNGDERLLIHDGLTIPSLVTEATEMGMKVALTIGGEPRDLDAGLELSLCRIVQEALTNVRKHAFGATASVELRYTPEGIEVEVTNVEAATRPRDLPIPGAGQGLVGIAERAALHCGRAEWGATPQGGFRVLAHLAEERALV